MEIWDLYNLAGEVIGEHVRGTQMPENGYHLVVHVWIRNAAGQYLMTQRSAQKKTYPLAWECVGGSVIQGEDSLTAALREVQEEVGIVLDTNNGGKVLTKIRDFAGGARVNDINDVYLFAYDGEIPLAEALTDEVAQACWMTRDEIIALYESGKMVSVIKDLSYFIENENGLFQQDILGGLRGMTESGWLLNLEDNEWPLTTIDHDRMIARGIVVDDENNFYFVRAHRDDDFGKADLIETAGGGVEAGEDLNTAIRRELSEELGVEVEVLCKIGVVSDYYNLIHRHNINNYFLCRVVSFGEKHLTKDEVEDFHLSTLKLGFDDALAEYERCRCTGIGRLVANREVPVLKRAKELLTEMK